MAEIICIFKRGGNRGIHPGAVVAVDLILWLAWVIIDVFLGAAMLVVLARYRVSGYGYSYDDDDATAEELAAARRDQATGRAMFAFTSFVL